MLGKGPKDGEFESKQPIKPIDTYAKTSINKKRPAINIISVEKEDGSFLRYQIWFYNNPRLGGLTSYASISEDSRLVEYIQKNLPLLDQPEITCELGKNELEYLVKSSSKDISEIIQHSDGRISIRDTYYKKDLAKIGHVLKSM